MNWMADQLGMSKSQMSRIVAGSRTVAEPDARALAMLVGGDFFSLFECPLGHFDDPHGTVAELEEQVA